MTKLLGLIGAGSVLAVSAGAILVQDGVVAKDAESAKPLAVGTKVPDSNVMTLKGEAAGFRSVLGGKRSVVVFYRGGWCPYCNRHLAELGQVKDELTKSGFQIVGVSPDTAEELNKTVDKNSLDYVLVSDSKADLMKAFGVAFRVDDETVAMYKERFNIDLERASGGQTHHILPVPAVFLVDEAGVIQYQYANPDYRVRLKGADLVAAAKKVAAR